MSLTHQPIKPLSRSFQLRQRRKAWLTIVIVPTGSRHRGATRCWAVSCPGAERRDTPAYNVESTRGDIQLCQRRWAKRCRGSRRVPHLPCVGSARSGTQNPDRVAGKPASQALGRDSSVLARLTKRPDHGLLLSCREHVRNHGHRHSLAVCRPNYGASAVLTTEWTLRCARLRRRRLVAVDG